MYNRIKEMVASPNELATVRQAFATEVTANPHLYDDQDIARVQTDEWTVKRFIGYKKHDLSAATDALVASMRWRKEWDVSNLSEASFPAEFYWIGECHPYARDRNNVATVYMRVKYHRKLDDWQLVMKKFLIHQMELMDNEIRNGADGWALIWDCVDGTIFNNNMDLLMFMLNTFFDHYPCALVYIGIYEIPWVLWAIYRVCRAWLPEDYRKLFVFLYKTNIDEHVGSKNLPIYLGGTCALRWRNKRTDCLAIQEFAQREGIKPLAVKRLLAHYNKWLKVADVEERARDKQDSLVVANNCVATITCNLNQLSVN